MANNVANLKNRIRQVMPQNIHEAVLDKWRRWRSETRRLPDSEKGEGAPKRGVGPLRYVLILGENSDCQVPICAVAA